MCAYIQDLLPLNFKCNIDILGKEDSGTCILCHVILSLLQTDRLEEQGKEMFQALQNDYKNS